MKDLNVNYEKFQEDFEKAFSTPQDVSFEKMQNFLQSHLQGVEEQWRDAYFDQQTGEFKIPTQENPSPLQMLCKEVFEKHLGTGAFDAQALKRLGVDAKGYEILEYIQTEYSQGDTFYQELDYSYLPESLSIKRTGLQEYAQSIREEQMLSEEHMRMGEEIIYEMLRTIEIYLKNQGFHQDQKGELAKEISECIPRLNEAIDAYSQYETATFHPDVQQIQESVGKEFRKALDDLELNINNREEFKEVITIVKHDISDDLNTLCDKMNMSEEEAQEYAKNICTYRMIIEKGSEGKFGMEMKRLIPLLNDLVKEFSNFNV